MLPWLHISVTGSLIELSQVLTDVAVLISNLCLTLYRAILVQGIPKTIRVVLSQSSQNLSFTLKSIS